MADLSKYLSVLEMRCKCCGALPPALVKDDEGKYPYCFEHLFDTFDEVRERWGVPILINSGYRCPKRNQAVGGGLMSAHCFGLALDLNITGDEVDRFVRLVRLVSPAIRIGHKKYGGKLVHLDTGYYIWPRPAVDFIEAMEW
jgi:hypothetical protein